MNTVSLAEVGYAIFCRMAPSDQKRIQELENDSLHASLHLGNSSQIQAQAAVKKAFEQAIDNMNEHDRDIIRSVITREATKTTA